MDTLAEAQAVLSERDTSLTMSGNNLDKANAVLQEREKTEPSFLEKAGTFISDTFTGNDRATESSDTLPELAFSGLLSGEDLATVAKISPALLTTLDPAETAKIITSNFPDIGVIQDEKGNLILENSKNGAIAVINRPGFSGTDALQAGGLAAEFTPAAKLGSGAGNIIKKIAAVGGGSAATEGMNQALQSQAGGEFNAEDVAIAGTGGAVFEGIFQGLANAFPIFRESVKTAGGKITDSVRKSFKDEAVKKAKTLGSDPVKASDEVTDEVIKKALFPEGEALAGEKEFSIQLTKGQRSGKQADLQLEDDLLTGRLGTDKSQETMVARRAETQSQAQESSAKLQQSLGKEGQTIASQQEAGALVNQGIRSAEQQAKEKVGKAFESVGDAALEPDAFVNLFQATKDAIKGIDFPITSETPATKALLKQINSAQKFFKKKGVKLKPQHINRIEQIRRSIGAQVKSAANPTDKRNLTTMKKAYDNFLDEAVTNALFTGDQDALNALKGSRSVFKEYARKFRANPKKTPSGGTIADAEGKIIETIVNGNPTDIQTVNSLFGAGNTFGKATAKNLAVKYKNILGKDSAEWGSVRQAAFKRLIRTGGDGKTISGRQTQKAINDAVEKNGELMSEIFSKDEIATLKRFAAQVVRSQPDIIKGSANPSGTGKIVNKGLAELTAKLTTMMGFASGNPVLIAAGQGVKVGSGFGAEKAAKDAVRPFGKIISPSPALVGGSVAATQEVTQ